VRRLLPDLARRHLARLPEAVQREHERWQLSASCHRLDLLQRARSLAQAMLDVGDDSAVIEPQLVAVGIPPTTAAEAVELVRAAREDHPSA
jgi:hypothetical protein